MPSAARFSEPAKITSSDLRVRSDRPCSPRVQRRASARFDLPEPFGPTTALMPGPNSTTVRSANDLKPCRRRPSRRGGPLIGRPLNRGRTRHASRGFAPQSIQRSRGRLRLGYPTGRSLPHAENPVAHRHLDSEAALVIGTGDLEELVVWPQPARPLRVLLEPAFWALEREDRRVVLELGLRELGQPAPDRVVADVANREPEAFGEGGRRAHRVCRAMTRGRRWDGRVG